MIHGPNICEETTDQFTSKDKEKYFASFVMNEKAWKTLTFFSVERKQFLAKRNVFEQNATLV